MKIWISWGHTIGPMLHMKFGERHFALCFCHHDPERSVPFFGLEKFLCARCLGMIAGMIAGAILVSLNINLPIVLMVLCIIPLILDGCTQALNWRTSSNTIRIISGFLFGIGAIQIVLGLKL